MPGLRWCERCGNYFTPTNRDLTMNLGIGARGAFVDPVDSVCDACLKPNEERDTEGNVKRAG